MKCKECGSESILQLGGKCSDLCWAVFQDINKSGYVPNIPNLGGGDYIELKICTDCGQVQGKFPKRPNSIVKALKEM